jgi:hypothetical protein
VLSGIVLYHKQEYIESFKSLQDITGKMSDIFLDKLREKIPEPEHWLKMMVTYMGCAGLLGECILKNIPQKEWVKLEKQYLYALGLTATNIIPLISSDFNSILKPIDLSEGNDYKMSEQTEEKNFRTMKEVIYTLYETLKKMDEI